MGAEASEYVGHFDIDSDGDTVAGSGEAGDEGGYDGVESGYVPDGAGDDGCGDA